MDAPECTLPVSAHLSLELEHAVEQCLRCRWATGDVDVDRHYAVAATHNRIGVVVVPTAIGARTHGYDPSCE